MKKGIAWVAINWALGVFESISAGWVSIGDLITDPKTYDLSWLPQTATMNIQNFEAFTNAGTWYRSERFGLENGYLMAEQDHMTLDWEIEAQDTVVGSVDTSSLQVSFDIFNEMDYPQYEPHTYTYNFDGGIAP